MNESPESNSVRDLNRSTGELIGRICCRIVLPIIVVAVLCAHFVIGTASVPQWMSNMTGRFGINGIQTAQILIGIEVALLGLMLFGQGLARWAAIVFSGALAFVLIAELSAGGALAGLPLVIFAIATIVLFLIAAGIRWQPQSNHRWSFVAAILLVLLSPVFAMVAPKVAPGLAASQNGSTLNGDLPPHYVFEFSAMEGQPLADQDWLDYADLESSDFEHGTHFIYFYRTECSSCHVFAEDHFANRTDLSVIAIRVMPSPRQDVAEGDDLGEIDCGVCTKHVLPAGPLWFVSTPALIVVQDGVIICAAERDCEECLQAGLNS